MGVMEGESAVQAVHGPALAAARAAGRPVPPEVDAAVEAMRAEYDTQLDARFAAARGFVDAVIYPEETRDVIAMLLRTAAWNPGPHLGAFVLPPDVAAPATVAGPVARPMERGQ
jgi:3-methylcrotonyl-CoA carboxylase beta subunit